MTAAQLIVGDDGVGEVVLDRPAVKNAIDGPLGTALAAAVTEADARDDVRVLLLRGLARITRAPHSTILGRGG